jgi:arginine deiminase
VPISQDRATMHLDTICTMVDVDAVVMYPNVAHNLSAIAVRPALTPISVIENRLRSWRRGTAMDIDQLQLIDTGLTLSPLSGTVG